MNKVTIGFVIVAIAWAVFGCGETDPQQFNSFDNEEEQQELTAKFTIKQSGAIRNHFSFDASPTIPASGINNHSIDYEWWVVTDSQYEQCKEHGIFEQCLGANGANGYYDTGKKPKYYDAKKAGKYKAILKVKDAGRRQDTKIKEFELVFQS